MILDNTDNKMVDELLDELRVIGETKYSDRDWLLRVSDGWDNDYKTFDLSHGTLEIHKYNNHFEGFDYRPFPESEIYISRENYE